MMTPWLALSQSMFEVQHVMWLRTWKIMQGGSVGRREASRMLTEKVDAHVEAAFKLAAGSSGDDIMRGYTRKVRANRKRLSR